VLVCVGNPGKLPLGRWGWRLGLTIALGTAAALTASACRSVALLCVLLKAQPGFVGDAVLTVFPSVGNPLMGVAVQPSEAPFDEPYPHPLFLTTVAQVVPRSQVRLGYGSDQAPDRKGPRRVALPGGRPPCIVLSAQRVHVC